MLFHAVVTDGLSRLSEMKHLQLPTQSTHRLEHYHRQFVAMLDFLLQADALVCGMNQPDMDECRLVFRCFVLLMTLDRKGTNLQVPVWRPTSVRTTTSRILRTGTRRHTSQVDGRTSNLNFPLLSARIKLLRLGGERLTTARAPPNGCSGPRCT